MKLPTEVDKKVCTMFSMRNQTGYKCGYTMLCEVLSYDDALFTTFCHWLLDEHADKRIEIDDNFLEIKSNTYSIAFRTDYRYEFKLNGKFLDYNFSLEIGDYSRYNVGLGTYLNDMVERFAQAVGRYDNYGFQGLIELNHLITE